MLVSKRITTSMMRVISNEEDGEDKDDENGHDCW